MVAQAPAQKITQQRLETYLSTLGAMSLEPSSNGNSDRVIGSGSIKELNTRLKILEIFALHVLPRNEEWEYAREFVKLNEFLDEERKDCLLQTMKALQEQPQLEQRREQELKKQREAESAFTRGEEERRRANEASEKESPKRRRQDVARRKEVPESIRSDIDRSNLQKTPDILSNDAVKKTTTTTNKRESTRNPASQPLSPSKKPRKPSQGLYRKLSLLLHGIPRSLMQVGQGLSRHPMMILRTILFIVALLMALTRRDVRDRLMQIRDSTWDKVKRTVGMGVKVSYI